MQQKMCKNITEIDDNDFVGFGKQLDILCSKISGVADNYDEINFNENHMGTNPLSISLKISYTSNKYLISARQYLYQTCNEFGNFFTTSSMHQPFGNRLFFTSQISECKKYFGPKYTIDYINNKIDETMAKYGSQEPHVDKVYFTKAEHDPWRYAGVLDKCATVIPGKKYKYIFKDCIR